MTVCDPKTTPPFPSPSHPTPPRPRRNMTAGSPWIPCSRLPTLGERKRPPRRGSWPMAPSSQPMGMGLFCCVVPLPLSLFRLLLLLLLLPLSHGPCLRPCLAVCPSRPSWRSQHVDGTCPGMLGRRRLWWLAAMLIMREERCAVQCSKRTGLHSIMPYFK